MELQKLMETAFSRVDETLDEADDTTKEVIINAILQAYVDVRSRLDRRIKTVSFTAADALEIPSDCIEVTRVIHSNDGEYGQTEYYRNGNYLQFYPPVSGGTMQILYVSGPDINQIRQQNPIPLTTEIDIKDVYSHALITYAAYQYQLYRRKYSAAQMLLQEYQSILQPEAEKPKN